jgi:hypothetical protein
VAYVKEILQELVESQRNNKENIMPRIGSPKVNFRRICVEEDWSKEWHGSMGNYVKPV